MVSEKIPSNEHGKKKSSAKSLKRCLQHASVLLIGSTGDGKSATINHLLNTDTINTGSYEPETRETVEYLVAVNNHDNEDDSDLKLGIIDTPGLNDPRGIKQDACNLHSIKQFFETHSQYSKAKCYLNLIFLVISANEHRMVGKNSKLANTLRALKELGVVDQNYPNVVVVLTFCCSVSYHNVQKWGTIMEEKKNVISRSIHEAFGIEAPVVLLENDRESNDLKNDDGFTLLPNNERQPENLYKVCQKILEDNDDLFGLSAFNAGLAQCNGKKQYLIAEHKVLANDSTKNSISEDEQDLLNILRGSSEDGKEIVKKTTGGRKKRELREYSVLGWAVSVPACLLWYTWFSLLWFVSWLLDKTFRFFHCAWLWLVWLVSWLLDKKEDDVMKSFTPRENDFQRIGFQPIQTYESF